jgi:hypothetical protein
MKARICVPAAVLVLACAWYAHRWLSDRWCQQHHFDGAYVDPRGVISHSCVVQGPPAADGKPQRYVVAFEQVPR